MKTANATAEPEREPTNFTEYVEALEDDPVERVGLEEARARVREEVDEQEADRG
jgi:hypothetical protein